jgi:hypothetical protein
MIRIMPGEPAASATPATPAPLLLGYGRAPSRLRRWLRRLFLLAWFAAFCWLAYDKWGVQARLLGLLIYRQHECLTHTEPADRVVIDLYPLRVPALGAQKSYRLAPHTTNLFGSGVSNPIFAAAYQGIDDVDRSRSDANAMWDHYQLILHPPSKEDLIRAWMDFDGSLGNPGTEPDARFLSYMHERGTGNNPSRLVILAGAWYGARNGVELEADVYERSYSSPGKQLSGRWNERRGTSLRIRSPDKSPTLRLFAGRSDPNDASRFTLRYETATGNGTIEGRLSADDTVMLRVLDGPIVPGFLDKGTDTTAETRPTDGNN